MKPTTHAQAPTPETSAAHVELQIRTGALLMTLLYVLAASRAFVTQGAREMGLSTLAGGAERISTLDAPGALLVQGTGLIAALICAGLALLAPAGQGRVTLVIMAGMCALITALFGLPQGP